jgi:adenine-specific DNA-methyltransferase
MSTGAPEGGSQPFVFEGREYRPPANSHWKTTLDGLGRLAASRRIIAIGNRIEYKRYLNDFPVYPLANVWMGMGERGFVGEKYYVVQTDKNVIARCVLMTTDPGDLVLDPTCGSGTTAYVAEQWGRRWITIDTSRVPLALARQRLLTATFPYYELKDESRGPAGGFVYERKQNQKGEDVGGIVPHIKLEDIANNEPSKEEVLVDRPEEDRKITRVTGPLCVEATIPTPVDWEDQSRDREGAVGPLADARGSVREDHGTFVDRMLEVLRRSPVLHVGGSKTVTLKNVRQPAKTLSLSAEALVEATAPGQKPDLEDAVREAKEKDGGLLPMSGKAVAIVFGPENGAISEKLVYEAAREAHAKAYTHLYVIGFAIQPNARKLVEDCEAAVGVPATYVQATPDLMMGDLLKNMRSSQIFSVCGLPEVEVVPADAEEVRKLGPPPAQAVSSQVSASSSERKPGGKADSRKLKADGWFQVKLLGLDVFDPTTMETDHRPGDDVPCWLLDTDYNGLCFHVCQAFFPRTAAWDDLKRALRGEYDDSVWEHLAGTTSAPFQPGEHGQVAVKVIDDRGNELMVVKSLAGWE